MPIRGAGAVARLVPAVAIVAAPIVSAQAQIALRGSPPTTSTISGRRLASKSEHYVLELFGGTLMRRFLVALALFASVLTGQSATGAVLIESSAAPRATVRDIRPNGQPIDLGVGAGTLIYLPAVPRTIFVADQKIADVQLNSSNAHFIYVFGKKPGTTVLYAQDAAGHIILNNAVVVATPPQPVTIIRGAQLYSGKPPPAPNFLVLPLQPAAEPTGKASPH